MREVRLRIDRIAVELAQDARVEHAEETLRQALALLAARLATAPLGAGPELPARALELLEIGSLPPQWLSSPGAAARLADELYARLWRPA